MSAVSHRFFASQDQHQFPWRARSTYDPLILNTSLLNRCWLLKLLAARNCLLLRFEIGRIDSVSNTSHNGSSDQVHGKKLQIEPVLRGLDDLNVTAVGVDTVLLAGLFVIDQQAELDGKLLRLELRDKVEGNLDGTTTDGTKRTRLEGSCGHVAENAASLTIVLLGVEEGAGDGLKGEQTVIFGRVGDGEDYGVCLAVLDNCGINRQIEVSILQVFRCLGGSKATY